MRTCVMCLVALLLLTKSLSAQSQETETRIDCEPEGSAAPEEERAVDASGQGNVLLAYGVHTELATIMPSADIDSFVFEGRSGERVRVVAAGLTADLDLQLEICPQGQEAMSSGSCKVDRFGTCSAVLDACLSEDGLHTVLVRDLGGDNTGDYVLQIESLARESAAEIALGVPIHGRVDVPTDQDLWSLGGLAGSTVRVTVSGRTSDLDPRIEVVSEAGEETVDVKCGVEVATEFCEVDRFGVCGVALEKTFTVDDSHWLIVSDRGFDNTGEYTLNVDCLANCPEPPVRLTYGDHTRNCAIFPASDTDTFGFFANAGELVCATVSGLTSDLDLKIELRDASAEVLQTDVCSVDRFSTCSAQVEACISAPGEYTVVLSDDDSVNVGDYVLQLERLDAPDANVLPFNRVVSGCIEQRPDRDVWTFQGIPGAVALLTLTGKTSDLDGRIEVFCLEAGCDAPILENSCSVDRFSTCSVALELEMAEGCTYQVVVSDVGYDNTGDFDLNLECLTGDCPQDAEDSTPIQPGQYTDGCSISPAADIDTFLLSGRAGESLRVVASGLAVDLDLRLEVRDSTGAAITTGSCAVDRFGTCAAVVTLCLPSDGDYTVVVFDDGHDNAGEYVLQVEDLGREAVVPLAFNAPVSDRIDVVSDQDLWTFEGAEGVRIIITLSGQTNDFDGRIELRGPGGGCESATVTECCQTDRFGRCAVELDTVLTSGKYSLIVSDCNFDNVGDYDLNVQCIGANCPDLGGETAPNVETPVSCQDSPRFKRGDCDQDGTGTGAVNDAVFLLNWLFNGGPAPDCLAACDFNADGAVPGDPGDAVFFLNFNFLGGAAMLPPVRKCDYLRLETDVALGCETPLGCRGF